MSDFQKIARDRMAALTTARRTTTTPVQSSKIHRDTSKRNFRLIETPEDTKHWDEFNLPEWLAPLVQNLPWAKRYASLLNDGHEAKLRKLVEVIEQTSHTNRMHMLNASCSHANWEATAKRMAELLATERLANEVVQRLEATGDQKLAIYAVCYRLRDRVLSYAASVQEKWRQGRIKTNAFKYFAYITSEKAMERQRLAAAAWASRATA
ncbi:hypothetical protein ACFY3G_18310 [Streptomyces phaeochromogenes]|uniref:hypothetical protein n=1 Tax=Streptomyces phaeochromogenes TaxID=1923 RepID=UPI00368DB5C6